MAISVAQLKDSNSPWAGPVLVVDDVVAVGVVEVGASGAGAVGDSAVRAMLTLVGRPDSISSARVSGQPGQGEVLTGFWPLT